MTSSEEMQNEVFLAYLKEYKPYLFDIEYMINKLMAGSGYGKVSVELRIADKKVEKSTILNSEEKLYVFRKNNRL